MDWPSNDVDVDDDEADDDDDDDVQRSLVRLQIMYDSIFNMRYPENWLHISGPANIPSKSRLIYWCDSLELNAN